MRFYLILWLGLTTLGANLNYSPAPVLNPMKGWVPYQSTPGRTTFPHTLSYMDIALRDCMTGPTTFTWSAIDTQITAATNEHCQFVFRIYLDFPGNSTGIPQYLLNGGLTTYPYTLYGNTTSVSPNWEDVNLRIAMTNFVAAMGARYDGDPRVAAVELGLLGFWAEWHDEAPVNFASPTVQAEVANGYRAAFHKTQMLMRVPNTNALMSAYGYYDDSFEADTLSTSANGFLLALTNASLQQAWQSHMIGGEVYPNYWYCQFSNPACGIYEYTNCMTNAHPAWMMNSGAFSTAHPLTTGQRSTAMAQSYAMGYELYVSQASINSNSLSVVITNTGVSPFYYPWQIQIQADAQSWTAPWSITNILPRQSVTRTTTLTGMNPGPHTFQIKVVDPMVGGVPFCFANTGQNTNTGWLTLFSQTIFPVTPTQLKLSKR